MAKVTTPTIFSGIQPSGTLHLGNYLGAIKQWIALQDESQGYYCIVDEHAITIDYNPAQLPKRVLDTAAFYLAAGLNPDQSTIFVQSHVSAHTQLSWLLATTTPFGEITRMTQFKDKSGQQKNKTTVGLFAYPLLMAADILLYQTNLVPVGEDQTQHVELTRSIAKRFNNRFGEVFTIPQARINKATARIMSLSDPSKKMSKTDHEKSYIALLDNPATITKKITSAVTETDPIFSFTKSGPAVKNLLNIYQAITDQTEADIEKTFAGQGYSQFKASLTQALITYLTPLQEKYQTIRRNDDELRILLGRGKHKAETVANQTLVTVRQKMGLL